MEHPNKNATTVQISVTLKNLAGQFRTEHFSLDCPIAYHGRSAVIMLPESVPDLKLAPIALSIAQALGRYLELTYQRIDSEHEEAL